MSAILCEGAVVNMATFKIFKQYIRLKNEIAELEEEVKKFGFNSIEECATFIAIASSKKAVSKKDISNNIPFSNNSIANFVLRLEDKALIISEVDPTDSRGKTLRRLLYSPTPRGIYLYDELKQQLQ